MADLDQDPSPLNDRDADAIGRVLRHATDITTDAWAVLRTVRDGGRVVDLELLYGNAAYWTLTGFDPATAIGRRLTELIPGLDWTRGVAALSMRALEAGTDIIDRHARLDFQATSLAGDERVFELEFAVVDDLLSVGFRDITADVLAQERQAIEAHRNEAVARFLSIAVDPTITPGGLLDALAQELAQSIGDLCAILEILPSGDVRVAAVAGGPGDVAERIRVTHVGHVRPSTATAAQYRGETILMSTISSAHREGITAGNAEFGLPRELAETISSMMLAPIRRGGTIIGRINVERFGDVPGYTLDDQVAVEALTDAAALVLERRAAEALMAASLERFEALFEQAPIPMIFGGEGGIRFNGSACALFARDEEDLRRLALLPDSPWIPEDGREAWVGLRQSFRSREAVRGARFAILRPTGERRQVEASAIPLTGPDLGSAGVVVVINDLTERESLEAQLRHAQKMEALGRLAGGIAHDFNNVLMAILGYAEFVVADIRRGTPSIDDAEQVVAATRKAIDLTARLTTFARRDPSRHEVVEVDALVRAVLPLVRRLAPTSIEIVTELHPGPPVLLDAVEFEQVIVNLVVNAVDAMPGGGRLTIETQAVELDVRSTAKHLSRGSGPHLLVAVSDTGAGMDDATRHRIFEPFYTTKGIGQGTGLGLSMVFAAVERAQGTIWVYSEPGHGSTFKIYLPPSADAGLTVGGGPAPPHASVGGTETILVVEDDEQVRDLVVRGLLEHGYEVTAAALPSEALRLAAERRFDVFVTDVVMPEMTGDAVAQLLRVAQPTLPVVYMSGYTANVLTFELGPRDTLVGKPVTSLGLARAVREALDRDTIPS